MNETLTNTPERKLWYDGPNYTADAVILDLEANKILLIERTDTGEWALPGGFINPSGESSLEAAIREAEEEAGVTGIRGGALIYRGRTSDRRSTGTAWIETSAHLFHHSHEADIKAGDDADSTDWHDLDSLPPLYGAHQMILERALDYSDSETLLDIVYSAERRLPVEGGYMQYDKWIAEKDNERAFVKRSPEESARFDELQLYLEKEAATMAHLRQHGFKHVPEKSALRDTCLVMDSLRPEDGWQWEASPETLDAYLHGTLSAFAELEEVPLPPESFPIKPSYESVLSEGWGSFDDSLHEQLREKIYGYLDSLPPELQQSALRLLGNIVALHDLAITAPAPDKLVLCHHDIRQSNLAWHPDMGTKIIDWSWAGPGLPGTDSTGLLIDLHKNGYDVSDYREYINPQHCLNLMGFWLQRATLPDNRATGLRYQQFTAALSAYELLEQ